MNSAKEKIIKEIFEAFKNVTLEGGVGLLESEIIDDYGSDTQRKNARNQDEKLDWQKLVNSEIHFLKYVIKELETEYAYDLVNLQNSIDQYWSKADS